MIGLLGTVIRLAIVVGAAVFLWGLAPPELHDAARVVAEAWGVNP